MLSEGVCPRRNTPARKEAPSRSGEFPARSQLQWENSLEQWQRSVLGRGLSTSRADSRANRPTSLKMTGTKGLVGHQPLWATAVVATCHGHWRAYALFLERGGEEL